MKRNLPTREECLKILVDYRLDEKKIRHCELVAEVAVFLGKKLVEKGERIDLKLVEVGGLLHDVARTISKEKGTHHAIDGERIVRELGLNKIEQIVRKHSLTFILGRYAPVTWEEKLVYYADKRVKYSIVSLDERTSKWPDKYPEQKEDILESVKRAKKLEKEIFDIIKIKPEELEEEMKE